MLFFRFDVSLYGLDTCCIYTLSKPFYTHGIAITQKFGFPQDRKTFTVY